MTPETVTANNGETLWAVMVRVENTKSVERYKQWQEAKSENAMGAGEVVNVPGKDE